VGNFKNAFGNEWIGLREKFNRENPIFHWKIQPVSGEDFPLNQSVEGCFWLHVELANPVLLPMRRGKLRRVS